MSCLSQHILGTLPRRSLVDPLASDDMSDDFDDDYFLVDDSFLREVDSIESKATTQPSFPSSRIQNGFTRANSLHTAGDMRGWTGPWQNKSSGSTLTSRTGAGPSRQPPVIGFIALPPLSDDYDDLPLPAASLAAFDSISSRPQLSKSIPSSRVGRTTSGNEGFLQTHLNFQRNKQSTKGKRWDRTAFAESGRRIKAEKAKGKGKGQAKPRRRGIEDDDEEDWAEEEEDWGEPLAPYPKRLVDPSESIPFP